MAAADRLHCTPFELAERPDGAIWMGRALAARRAENEAERYHRWVADQAI